MNLAEMLFKLRVPYLTVLLGALAVFFSYFSVGPNFSFVPIAQPGIQPVIAGGVLIVLGLILVVFERAPARVPSIAGNWEYHVKDADPQRQYGHGGTAEITQNGAKIIIDGFRNYMSWMEGGERKEHKDITLHWRTSWALIDDHVLRYDYEIPLPGEQGRIMGYVRINLPKSGKLNQMRGIYCILPPFKTDLANTHWGTIEYKRIEKD